MMRISTAITAMLCILYISPAKAQDADRYDKKIESAAAARVAAKLGDLRGLIVSSEGKRFVTSDDMLDKPLSPQSQSSLTKNDPNVPPLVMGKNIDPVITGGSTKFDSEGISIPHHQDRHMSRRPSLVGDLLKALEINPFPGD